MKTIVIIKQNGKEKKVEAKIGVNLFELISENGFELSGYCGRQGICGKCGVKINPAPAVKDKEREFFSKKKLKEGWRLACIHSLEEKCEIYVEDSGDINVLTGAMEIKGELNSGWQSDEIKIKEPSLADQRSYLSRYLKKSDCEIIDDKLLNDIKGLQNKSGKLHTVSCVDKLVEIRNTKPSEKILGAAVDIGTTTLVLYLYNLENGERLAVESMYNPQKEYGADVISRIQYGNKNKENRDKLQEVLIEGLNKGLNKLTAGTGQKTTDIYRITLAGNTTMMHTVLGFDGIEIAKAPFIPTFTESLTVKPDEIELDINKRGEVVLLPSISSYVGADILADLLATGAGQTPECSLLVDIGTNGEIVLGSDQKLYACSVAAGPSFEGSNISSGMAALSGAVEKFNIEKDGFDYQTIGDGDPRGICGSGLLDLAAGLLDIGVITPSGSFAEKEKMPPFWQDRFYPEREIKELSIIKDEDEGKNITLTQKDIRQLQLAKGAIRAGIEVLLKKTEYRSDDVTRVYLVGGFANYLDPENAVKIGMISEKMEDKIVQAGNGSGAGASLYLLDRELKEASEQLKSRINYIELSSDSEFQQEFTAQMGFPR